MMNETNVNEGNLLYNKRLFYIIKKRWKIIFAFLAASVILSIIYIHYFTLPVYSSSTLLFVYRNNDTQSSLNSEINAGAQLVNDVAVIIKSGPVLEKSLIKLGNPKDITKQQLAGSINSTIEKDTRLLKVSVTNKSPYEAARIANVLSNTLVERFDEIMKAKTINNTEFVSIIEEAAPDTKPVNPNKALIVIEFLMTGLILGIGTLAIFEYFDNSIKSPDEVEWCLGSNILAIVPKFDNK